MYVKSPISGCTDTNEGPTSILFILSNTLHTFAANYCKFTVY